MTAAKSTSKTNKSFAKSGATPASYADLEAELREIIVWFEGETFDVDEAVAKYRRGLELVQQLEAYLKTAENKVTELQAKFNTANASAK